MKPEKKCEFEEILEGLAAGDPRLAVLDLCGFELEITDITLLSKLLSKVTVLNLAGNKLGDDAIVVLAKVLPQTQIRELILDDNKIGAKREELRINARMEGQYSYRHNDLETFNQNEDGIYMLAGILDRTCIELLSLKNNLVEQWHAEQLARVLPRTKIRVLNLEQNIIWSAGLESLSARLLSTQITELHLRSNVIDDQGIQVLAKLLPKSKITCLSIDVKSTNMSSLAQFIPQSLITKLVLCGNQVKANGYTELLRVIEQSKITELEIDGGYSSSFESNEMEIIVQILLLGKIKSFKLVNFWAKEEFVTLINVLSQLNLEAFGIISCNMNAKVGILLTEALLKTQIETLDLSDNSIGDEVATALAKVLPQTKIKKLRLNKCGISNSGVLALAQACSQSRMELIDLSDNFFREDMAIDLSAEIQAPTEAEQSLCYSNTTLEDLKAILPELTTTKATTLSFKKQCFGDEGLKLLVQVLPQTQLIKLVLQGNMDYIGDGQAKRISSKGAAELAKVLPKTQLISLDVSDNYISSAGAKALLEVLSQTQIEELYLRHNYISSVEEFAASLVGANLNILNLDDNGIEDPSLVKMSEILPTTELIDLSLQDNRIYEDGILALAAALPKSKITRLNLCGNPVGDYEVTETSTANYYTNATVHRKCSEAMLQAVKSSYSITALAGVSWICGSSESDAQFQEKYLPIINNHLAINNLLTATQRDDKTLEEFIAELLGAALMYINQPKLLDDPTFEKPRRLLIKAKELGSVQAIYLLADMHLTVFKNADVAKEYYQQAASQGHIISTLCLQMLEQENFSELRLGDLAVKLPRRFSQNTRTQKLALRQQTVALLGEPDVLVSKTGVSLAALNELATVSPVMDVFVAIADYEPIEPGELHFSKGQTIYIKNPAHGLANLSAFMVDDLAKCFIPYNRDRKGNRRADVGAIPPDMYLHQTHFMRKPRNEWSAEEVCNAIIVPITKPKYGNKSKPYVDRLQDAQRGKPFEGWILSYARASRFTDILGALNESLKNKNPTAVFIWIDLVGINQHAWMQMNSDDIGKILEVNLKQLFTHVSDGRLIHFDRARPTNLTRSWCLLELLSCLTAQVQTVAQTEICMTSTVQAQVLSQDLTQLLNDLDSSKAQCFNPEDKKAIDAQIRSALTNAGELEISMQEAYARLNTVVKSWLLSKFLPDLDTSKQSATKPLTTAFDHGRRSSQISATPADKQPVPARRTSVLQKLRAKFGG
jgi:hypothetical protein